MAGVLSGAALLAGSTLAALLGLHLLHLALQLLGFAAQHLLLPALLEVLRLLALLLGQFLLALGERVQLGKRIVDLFSLLLSRRAGLRGLVLILLGVHLEIEEAGQVAAGAASTPSASALLTEGDLNLAEGRLRPQQSLERLLLVGQSVLPGLLLEFFGRGNHGPRRHLHILLEAGKLLIGRTQSAALHARGERKHLLAQRGLRLRQRLAYVRGVGRSRRLIVLLLPGGGDQFFFAPRDVGLVAGTLPTSTAAASASLLRLRELALKRVHLDEADVCLRLLMTIFSGRIQADDVAGDDLKTLQAQGSRAV